MTEEQAWSVEFYLDEQGGSPVRKFLMTLDRKTQARFDWSIEQLRRSMSTPTSRWSSTWMASCGSCGAPATAISTGLSISSSAVARSCLSMAFEEAQKTPRRELELAQKRMDDYIRRKGGE